MHAHTHTHFCTYFMHMRGLLSAVIRTATAAVSMMAIMQEKAQCIIWLAIHCDSGMQFLSYMWKSSCQHSNIKLVLSLRKVDVWGSTNHLDDHRHKTRMLNAQDCCFDRVQRNLLLIRICSWSKMSCTRGQSCTLIKF